MKTYSYNKTITQLFEESVVANPNNIAIYDEDKYVTYDEFNKAVNRYAHYLREQGVHRHCIVAIDMKRSYRFICLVFAILKAGGIYMPIASDFPNIRKLNMLQQAQIAFFITDDANNQVIDMQENTCHIIADSSLTVDNYSDQNLSHINHPKDTAYIIFTSGSTGKPKGVPIAHHALVNRIEWMQAEFPIDQHDILFQKTHCSFDVSLWEIFWWSITGASLLILPEAQEDNLLLIAKLITKFKVSVIHFVPTVFNLFLDYLSLKKNICVFDSLRYVFVSGEALDLTTVSTFHQQASHTKLVNLYGPTEATIDVSFHVCDRQKHYTEIPIGRPIQNIEFMIQHTNAVTPDSKYPTGELYIAGVGVANGYLNDPKRTRNSFVEYNKKVYYKTGDLVKLNSAGELCYLGRIDQQVKINGIRIELNEIENSLQKHPDIQQAVVICIDLSGCHKKLVAFVKISHYIQQLDRYTLHKFISQILPSYMLPHEYEFVSNFPLKVNGKLDREQLKRIYFKKQTCHSD